MRTPRILLFHFALAMMALLISSAPAQGQGVGSITRIEKGRVTIDWGVMDGTTVGMYFDVYQALGRETAQLRNLSPEDKGFVGRLRVAELYNDYSISKFVIQQQDAVVGNFLQLVIDDQDPLNVPGMRTEKAVITDVKEGMAAFNLGRNDAVERGLLFDVVKYVLRPNPATGQPESRRRMVVGKIAVMDVQDQQSIGRVLAGGSNIAVGDYVELSDRQRGDIEMSRQMNPASIATRGDPMPAVDRGTTISGRVDDRSGDRLDITWKAGAAAAAFDAGSRIGIYRLEIITNDLTGIQVGAPLVRIGEAVLEEVHGMRGMARLLVEDVPIASGDLVGALDIVVTPVVAATAPKDRLGTSGALARQAQTRNEAYRLTAELMQVQRDLDALRAMSHRLDNMEQKIQQNSNSLGQIRRMVARIDDKLVGNVRVGPGSDRPELGIYQGDPAGVNAKHYVFSDGIDVKVIYKDNTAYLMLSMDSSAAAPAFTEAGDSVRAVVVESESATPVVPDPGTEEVNLDSLMAMDSEGTISSLMSEYGLYAGILLLLIVAGAGAFLFLKKKKSAASPAAAAIADDDEFDTDDEGEGEETIEAEEEMEEEEI